jgi:hypothetical protein
MTPEVASRLGRRAGLLLFLAALALRLAAIGVAGSATLRFGDARAYISAAEAIVETGHYPKQTDYFSFRAPGYPFFLAAVTLGHPRWIALAKAANALLGSAQALLLAILAARLFGRRDLALATGIAAALDPGLVFLSTDIQSEPLFVLFLTAAGFLLLVSADRPSSNFAVLAGGSLAVAALTRPSALALAPLLAAPLFDRRYPLRARAHLAASALLGFALAMTPWTLRNALVYRDVVPVNDFAGFNLYLGNSDLMDRFYKLESRREYEAWIAEYDGLIRSRFAGLEKSGEMSPSRRTRAFWKMTLEERRANPSRTIPLLIHKTWDWLRPYPNRLFWPAWTVWTTGVLYGLLSLLAVLGLIWSRRRGVSLFVCAYLALTLLSHVALIVVWRYRIAYWNPVLLVYGAAGAYWLRDRTAGTPLRSCGDVPTATSLEARR